MFFWWLYHLSKKKRVFENEKMVISLSKRVIANTAAIPFDDLYCEHLSNSYIMWYLIRVLFVHAQKGDKLSTAANERKKKIKLGPEIVR